MEGELAVNDIPFSRVLVHVPVQFLGCIDGSVSVICYAVVMTLCYCSVPLYTPPWILGGSSFSHRENAEDPQREGH
jgi:hypothetical protein